MSSSFRVTPRWYSEDTQCVTDVVLVRHSVWYWCDTWADILWTTTFFEAPMFFLIALGSLHRIWIQVISRIETLTRHSVAHLAVCVRPPSLASFCFSCFRVCGELKGGQYILCFVLRSRGKYRTTGCCIVYARVCLSGCKLVSSSVIHHWCGRLERLWRIWSKIERIREKEIKRLERENGSCQVVSSEHVVVLNTLLFWHHRWWTFEPLWTLKCGTGERYSGTETETEREKESVCVFICPCWLRSGVNVAAVQVWCRQATAGTVTVERRNGVHWREELVMSMLWCFLVVWERSTGRVGVCCVLAIWSLRRQSDAGTRILLKFLLRGGYLKRELIVRHLAVFLLEFKMRFGCNARLVVRPRASV